MLEIDYNERVANEMTNIPLSFYHLDKKHPAYYAPLHWHRPMELVRVISGRLKMYLDGQKKIVSPGEIVFINSEIIHNFFPNDCVYQIINFDADNIFLKTTLCKDILHVFSGNHICVLPFSKEVAPDIYHMANQLFDYASADFSNNRLLVLGALFELLGLIYATHHYTEKERIPTVTNRFKPLLQYVESSYMLPITVADMAGICNMSSSHFSVLFHNFFRQTPMNYLNAYRVERACLMLVHTEYSITEVSYRCGFNDSTYFIKVFKKYKNSTPKKYRTSFSTREKSGPD